MRIVSENSDAELARLRALADFDRRLRELTANSLRILGDAGNPYDFSEQLVKLLNAFISYRDVAKSSPSPQEIQNLLTIDRGPEYTHGINDDDRARYYEEQAIIRSSLRVVASHLLGQRTQESVAKNNMYQAIDILEDIRNEARKRFMGHGADLNRPQVKNQRLKQALESRPSDAADVRFPPRRVGLP